jgi:TolA-binding protein
MSKITQSAFVGTRVALAIVAFFAFVLLAGAAASAQPPTPAHIDMTPRYTVIEYGAQIDQMRRDVANLRGEVKEAQADANILEMLRVHDIAVRDAQIAEDRARIAALEQRVYDFEQMRMSDFLSAYYAQDDNLKRLYALELAVYCAVDGALCPAGGGP